MELPLLRVMHALMSGADSTVEQKEKYRPQVLAKCVCTPGTEYKSARTNFREAGLGDAPRALWPSERSVRRDVLRGFMGGDGGRHYGFVELRARSASS